MGATIDRLAVFYSPIKCSPLLPDGDKQARLAMPVKKEEVKLAMPVQKEEVEMATLKEEEIATMEAKVVDCLKPSNSVELAQPQGGLVSGTMPAPLPAYQPITFLSKPLDVEDAEDDNSVVFEGAHKEETGFQTASQGELIALIPKVEEPIVSEQVEMFNARPVEEEVVFQQAEVEVITTQDEKVEEVVQDEEQMSNKLVEDEVSLQQVQEEVIINQAVNEAEDIITAKQDPKTLVYSRIQEEEEEVDEVNENKVSFSMEDLEYDEATGQLFIHLESGMMEVTDLQCRDQLLAKMSSIPDDDSLLASIFPLPEARATPTLSHVPDVGEVLSATPPVLLKPINFRLQEQRLTFSHLGQSRAQSLGTWTSWTRDLLISDLEAAFTKPRRNIYWSDFSPTEKLACFDMVDWGATYPLDPPSRSLMFQPEEDPWSTWA